MLSTVEAFQSEILSPKWYQVALSNMPKTPKTIPVKRWAYTMSMESLSLNLMARGKVLGGPGAGGRVLKHVAHLRAFAAMMDEVLAPLIKRHVTKSGLRGWPTFTSIRAN